MIKSLRGTSVLLLLVLIALLAACGGADEQALTEELAPAENVPAAQPVANTAPPGPPKASYERIVGVQLVATDETPELVAEALAERRPVVILFYVPGSEDDSLVREALDKLEPKYEDILVVRYDFKAPDEFGDLARVLQIDYPPQLVFVTPSGQVRSVLSGYVDEGTLNMHLVNVRQG
jgi:ABC-type Fe3+-hydroxamate transport system substrate-binding protein